MPSPLMEPISFRCVFESLHADKDGAATIRLELPAAEVARAARLLVMGQVVFEATLTPVSVQDSEVTI